MPDNKRNRPTAAEQSKPKKGAARGKSAGKPSVKHSRREKDAAASVKRGQKSARGSGPPCEKCGQIHRRCSAHNARGGPCMQMPLRFQLVCRSHGGATKLSKQAAQERMLELVYPALARLEQLVLDPDTDPSIIVKVVAQILDRAHGAGLSRNASVEIGLGDSLFDKLLTGNDVFEFDRSALDGDAPKPELPSGGGDDGPTDEALDALLDERERRRAREAATKLDNSGHEVITAEVVDEDPHPTTKAHKSRTYRGHTTGTGPIEFPGGDPRNVGATEYDAEPGGRYSRPRSQEDLYESEEGS